MLRITMRCLILGLATLTTFYAQSSLIMKPSLDSDLIYPGAILEGTYNSAISKPEKFLGFEVGDRVATSLQIVESLEAWSSQSERIKVIEYARSHEGRPLHAVFISSPDIGDGASPRLRPLCTEPVHGVTPHIACPAFGFASCSPCLRTHRIEANEAARAVEALLDPS